MRALLHKISSGLRSRGLNYLVTAPVNELANPRLPITQYVRSAIIGVRDRFGGAKTDSQAWSNGALQLVYDLAASPVTFDFASYLAAAEVERRLRKLRDINVIFVLGPKAGVREELPDYEAAIDVPTRLARLRNILVPMLAFLPSVKGYAVCGSREQAEAIIAADQTKIYPSDYRVYLPRQPAKKVIFEHARAGVSIWPMLRATDAGKRFVGDFLAREAKGRKAVVITLRNYDYSPERNSHNADWIAFANSLDPAVYVPIFVHDTETSMRAAAGRFRSAHRLPRGDLEPGNPHGVVRGGVDQHGAHAWTDGVVLVQRGGPLRIVHGRRHGCNQHRSVLDCERTSACCRSRICEALPAHRVGARRPASSNGCLCHDGRRALFFRSAVCGTNPASSA